MEQIKSIRPSEQARRKRHKHKRFEITTIGAVVLGLAVVGLLGIVGFFSGSAVNYIKDYIGPAQTPTFYQNYISPVVMQDPPAFSDIKKASPTLLVKTAIWATLNEEANQGKYATTDDLRQILPIADINIDFVNLFGDEIKPNFQSFTDNGANFEYDAKAKCYYIPTVAVDSYFTPVVKTITPKNGLVKLTVGYIPSVGWGQNPNGTVSAPEPTKTMIYTLKGARGKYVIVAIEDAPAQVGNASTDSTVSQTATSSNAVSSSSSVASSSNTNSVAKK
jgi:hypothetical protein